MDQKIYDLIQGIIDGNGDPNSEIEIPIGKFPPLSLVRDPIQARALLDLGADRDIINEDGMKPIHVAALDGLLEIVKILAYYGADVDSKDRSGKTPLNYAFSCRYFEIERFLVEEAGADDNYLTKN